jgi:hypothetical protein
MWELVVNLDEKKVSFAGYVARFEQMDDATVVEKSSRSAEAYQRCDRLCYGCLPSDYIGYRDNV